MLINATPSAASPTRAYCTAAHPKTPPGKPDGGNPHVRFARAGDMKAESCSPMAGDDILKRGNVAVILTDVPDAPIASAGRVVQSN
jgi:hypothetical protein